MKKKWNFVVFTSLIQQDRFFWILPQRIKLGAIILLTKCVLYGFIPWEHGIVPLTWCQTGPQINEPICMPSIVILRSAHLCIHWLFLDEWLHMLPFIRDGRPSICWLEACKGVIDLSVWCGTNNLDLPILVGFGKERRNMTEPVFSRTDSRYWPLQYKTRVDIEPWKNW